MKRILAFLMLFSIAVQAAPPEKAAISIRVQDTAGTSVEGAQIEIQPFNDKSFLLQSDQDGRAQTELVEANFGKYWGRAAIAAPNLAVAGGFLKPGENVFSLGVPLTLSGRVVDAQNAPIVGAKARVSFVRSEQPAFFVALYGGVFPE